MSETTAMAMIDNNNKKKMKNKKKTKKKSEKSRGVGRPTREDYERVLTEYDELLAAAESEFGRMDRTGDEAQVAYDEAGARHRAVLGEIGHQAGRVEAVIDRYEADKARLNAGLAADRAASAAADELRFAQYGRALDGLRSDGQHVEGKYKAAALNSVRRAGLLDEIVAVVEHKDHLEEDQRDCLYAAEQIQISENVMIINDQERNIQNWFEMVKNNKKCTDQMEILDNINEENKKIYELSESQKEYYVTKKEKEKFHHQLSIKEKYEKIYLFKKEYSITSLVDDVYKRLNKQKEIAHLKKNQLLKKALNQKTSREKYFKNVKALTKLEYDENHMMNLVNFVKKELIKAKDFRKQKLNYIKKMYEEIAIIIEKANKFITGESKNNSKGVEWLQNRGMVKHFDGKPEYIS